jgi:tetratricopeptide (TPR) repeat protein
VDRLTRLRHRAGFRPGRALIAGGDHAAGVARYEELLARAGLPDETRLAILGQLSQARMYAGRIAEAEAAMEEVQRLAGPDRRDLTAGAMVDHAAQVMVTYGWKRAAPLAIRARELAAEASAPVRAAAAAVWAVGTYFSGDPAGLEVAEAAARSAATAPSWRPPGTPWWDPVAHYASLALSAERFGDAQRLLDSILEAAERRSDPMAVAQALYYRTTLRWRLGQLDEALALSARLLEAADLVPVMTPNAAAARAIVLLDLGRLGEAEDWCARAEAAAGAGDSLGYAGWRVLPAARNARPAAATWTARAYAPLGEIADALELIGHGPWAADAIPLPGQRAGGRRRRLIDWLAPRRARPLGGRRSSWRRASGHGRHNDDPETAPPLRRGARPPGGDAHPARQGPGAHRLWCVPAVSATPARQASSQRRCGWPRDAVSSAERARWNDAPRRRGAHCPATPRRPRWLAWPGPEKPIGRSPGSCT